MSAEAEKHCSIYSTIVTMRLRLLPGSSGFSLCSVDIQIAIHVVLKLLNKKSRMVVAGGSGEGVMGVSV